MIILLLSIIFSTIFVIFAVQNNFNINLTIANQVFKEVPFLLIIFISLVIGFILALVSSVYDYLISVLSFRRFEGEYNEIKKINNHLVNRLQHLETELEKIKKAKKINLPPDEDSL